MKVGIVGAGYAGVFAKVFMLILLFRRAHKARLLAATSCSLMVSSVVSCQGR